ncbi:MAG: hypothetical protein ACKVUS_13330 [Saprospiraceae bacterium]
MKHSLLALSFLALSAAPTSAQSCSFPAANVCEEAKFICGYALSNYTGNNFGYLNAPEIPGFLNCSSSFHNPQFLQIVPCADQISLKVTSFNCNTGDGLQLALADSCDGQIIACDGGFAGGAGIPLVLSADVVPGEPYILIVDGFLGDECEFQVTDIQGLDTNQPISNSVGQPGMITFQSLPCGPATLMLQLASCTGGMAGGCSHGWTDFYVDNCLGIEWNLPLGAQIISPDPHAFTITVQFTQPVMNGMVSVDYIHSCQGIDEDECEECIPKCCTAPIPPIFISSPASSYAYVPCEEAPAYCAGSLDLVHFNNGCSFGGFGWWQTADWGGSPLCFTLQNPNLYRVIACDGLSNLRFEVSNCENNRGLEFALMQGSGCDQLYSLGNCISVPEGQSGQFPLPFWYSPNEQFYLVVDGIGLDACDFTITEILNSGGNNGQQQCLVSQPTIEDFSPSWPFYTVSFEVTHPNESVVTGGSGSYNSGYFTSAPIACGTPYLFEIITGGCTQIVSGNSPCFLPPDCTNFNLPAPLADSCHQAPLLCGSYLEGYCSSTAGLSPDQPGFANNPIPGFDNNGWLRITPCDDSITIDFPVFDCQTGNELGFFLLSGDCDTMTLLSFVSAQDGSVAQLTAGGLMPGEIYYLAVEGLNNADCKFQVHVVDGIGTASPGQPICNCTDAYVDGPGDLCPADIVQYTLVPGSCTSTPCPAVGGNGYYCCPLPDSIKPDSAVLHWTIPPFMNFLSDSINVLTITVQVDSSLLGIDTVLNGTVSAYWEIIDLTPKDSNIYCDCCPRCIPGFLPKDVTVRHKVEIIYCELNCVQPCCFYNGQTYCSPGTYVVDQTNCLTKKMVVTANWAIPTADAGPGGVLTCINPSILLGSGSSSGPNFTCIWSGPGITPLNQFLPTVTVSTPGFYTILVTNTANGCTSSDNSFVTADFNTPSVIIPPVPKVCQYTEVTLTASGNPPFFQYNWSNNMLGQQITVEAIATSSYSVTVTNPSNGCSNTASVTVQVQPTTITNLGQHTICEGECLWVAGEELCSGGVYSIVATSYQGCDSIINVQINVKPYVVTNHGTVGALTCDVTSISFMGNTYTQPGNYTVPAANGCGEHQFVIDKDIFPPVVELGQQQEICAGQAATLAVSPILPSVEYLWSNSAIGTQIEVSPTATTTYVVTAQNLANGCLAFDQVTVNVIPSVDTDLGVVGLLACDQPEINFMGNTYTQPGQYSVPIPGGCGNNLFVILGDFSPPWCPIIPVPPVCAGESVTLQTAPPSPSSLNYLWSTGDTTQEVTVTPLVTTTYSVTAIDPTNGCMSIVATIVEVNQPQLVPLGLVGTLTCAQTCLTFNGVEYCQPGTYSVTENCEIKEFQIGQDLSLPTVQLGLVGTLTCAQTCLTFNGVDYCQSGTYSVTENCEIKEFQIGDLPPVWLELGEDQTIVAGESAELQAQTNALPAVITWLDSTGVMNTETNLDITVQPLENTLYSIEIQDLNGCLLEDSVWVLVENPVGGWYAPNVICPLSVDMNGWFTLFADPNRVAEIQLLEIYDRWGNLVFARKKFPPNAPESGWNGTQNGKIFDPAVFVWQAVLLLKNGDTVKVEGDVTVLR